VVELEDYSDLGQPGPGMAAFGAQFASAALTIEFVVAVLLAAGRLAGFDSSSRFYADDDLMAGVAGPFQLIRILREVVAANALRPEAGIAFMLDQCHNIEPKIPPTSGP
jgi:L-rhamnose isomerase